VIGGGYGGFEITNSTKLTVLSPARTVQRGRKYRIKWKGANTGRTVSIQLLRERVACCNAYVHDRWISRKTRNDGNFVWKFPLSLKDTSPWGRSGPRYKIKITATNGAVGEGGYFYVTGNISKLRCAGHTDCRGKFRRGDILPIRWKPGSDKDPVKISIRRGGFEKGHYRWITKKTRNDGVFNWKISGKSPRYGELRVTSIKNPTNWIEISFEIRSY
jgi:hypothetical protein